MRTLFALSSLIRRSGLPLFIQTRSAGYTEFAALYKFDYSGGLVVGEFISCEDDRYGFQTRPVKYRLDHNVFIHHGFDMPEKYTRMLSKFNENGRNPLTFDREGYDITGYDVDGYDRDGYSCEGYDRDGYDRDGFDKLGFSRAGYDELGYDHEGFDENGFDINGVNRWGINTEGYDERNYYPDKDGFYPNGRDEEGYDRNGRDMDGMTREEKAKQKEEQRRMDYYLRCKEFAEWHAASENCNNYENIAYGYSEEEVNEYGMPLYENDPYEDGPPEPENSFDDFDV